MEWTLVVHQVKYYVHVKLNKQVAFVVQTGLRATITQPD
jgi:hypothetical protein